MWEAKRTQRRQNRGLSDRLLLMMTPIMCYNDGMPRIGQIGGSKVRGTLLSYRIRVELGDLVYRG